MIHLLEKLRQAQIVPQEINIYTSLDAANPNNETNSIGDWTKDGSNIDVTSDATESSNGTYSIKLTNANETYRFGRANFNGLEIGESYAISFDYKSSGSSAKTYGWSGFTSSPDEALNSTSSFSNYNITLEASSISGYITFYPADLAGGSTSGEILYIDNINIIKQ